MAKDQNLIPMKSAFPRWLKRLDPFLENESDNAIYQAFRLRRVEHTQARLRGVFSFLTGKHGFWRQEGVVLSVMLASFCLYIFWGWVGIVVGLAALVVLPFFLEASKTKGETIPKIPRYAHRLFLPTDNHKQVAIELWMGGMRGRDWVEARHFEIRERWIQSIVWPSLFPIYVFALLCGNAALGTIHGLVLIVSALIFCLCLCFLSLAEKNLERKFRHAIISFSDSKKARMRQMMLISPYCVAGVLLAFIIKAYAQYPAILLAVGLEKLQGSSSPLIQELGYHLHYYIFTALFLMASTLILLHLYRNKKQWNSRTSHAPDSRLLSELDWAFNRFMICEVLKDPDGARWAEAVRGKETGWASGLERGAFPPTETTPERGWKTQVRNFLTSNGMRKIKQVYDKRAK